MGLLSGIGFLNGAFAVSKVRAEMLRIQAAPLATTLPSRSALMSHLRHEYRLEAD